MVASDKFTIRDDQGAKPNTGAGTKAPQASSVRVANDPKSAGRLRHAMRRFAVLQERVKEGKVKVVFVPDAQNASDFMTKWVPASKLKASVAYTSNEAAKRNTQQAKKTKIRSEASMLEVSMIENEHGRTMPDHVAAFGNFAQGHRETSRTPGAEHAYAVSIDLYEAFYGAEDSDDPELRQRPQRMGANPIKMPIPFSHTANKALLKSFHVHINPNIRRSGSEARVEEDEYADHDQGDRLHYDSDHLGSNSDPLDHLGRGQRAEEYDPEPAEPHRPGAGEAGPSSFRDDPRYFEFGEAGPPCAAQAAKKPKGRLIRFVYPAGSPGGTIDESHPGTIAHIWDDEADAYEGAEPEDDFPSYEDAERDARKAEKSRKRRAAGT